MSSSVTTQRKKLLAQLFGEMVISNSAGGRSAHRRLPPADQWAYSDPSPPLSALAYLPGRLLFSGGLFDTQQVHGRVIFRLRPFTQQQGKQTIISRPQLFFRKGRWELHSVGSRRVDEVDSNNRPRALQAFNVLLTLGDCGANQTVEDPAVFSRHGRSLSVVEFTSCWLLMGWLFFF